MEVAIVTPPCCRKKSQQAQDLQARKNNDSGTGVSFSPQASVSLWFICIFNSTVTLNLYFYMMKDRERKGQDGHHLAQDHGIFINTITDVSVGAK